MVSQQTQEQIRHLPLFRAMSPREFQDVVAKLEVVCFRFGQVIRRAGNIGDALYFVTCGKVRVVGIGADGEEVNLGTLEEQEHFGESSLLGTERIEFTLRASSDVTLLKLSRDSFQAILREHPALDRYFAEYLNNDSILSFFRKAAALAPIDYRALRSLLNEMQRCTFSPQTPIVKEGEAGDAFYILLDGSAEIVKPSQGGVVLSTLHPGDYFGELALLAGQPRQATVLTITECNVLKLAKDDFDRLIAQFPQIRSTMIGIARGYSDLPLEAEEPPIPDQGPPDSELPGGFAEDDAASETKPLPLGKVRKKKRYPFIRQQSMMDCGPTCLAMVLAFYGKQLKINRLKQMAGSGTEGTTLYHLAEAAEACGFETRGTKATLAHLENDSLPAILHWGGNHYVVLYEIAKDRAIVADPAAGIIRIPLAEVQEHWTGFTLFLSLTPKLLELQEDEQSSLSRYISVFVPYRRTLIDIFVLSLILQGISLATPIFTQLIVDQVLVYHNTGMLRTLLGAILAASLFGILFHLSRQFLLADMAQKVDTAMIVRFYRHVLSLPMMYFIKRQTGDILTRVNENEKIRRILTTTALGALLDSLTVIVYLVVMAVYSLQLTLIALLVIPLFVVLAACLSPVMRTNSRRVFQARAGAQSQMVEAVNGISTIRSLAAERQVAWSIEDKLGRVKRLRMQGSMIQAVSDAAGGGLTTIGQIAILFFGAQAVLTGAMSVGHLIAYSALFIQVTLSLNGLLKAWGELQEVRISLERLDDVFDTEPEQSRPDRLIRLPAVQGRIRFENVTFRYDPDGRNIISNFTLDVEPGQTVALVGRSGAGKSTLYHLLLKMHKPVSGRILIDGFDVRQIHAGALRARIGVVQQENLLFRGTIRDNIAYRMPDAPLEAIIEAAALAGAHEFIADLPLGYETMLGEQGAGLSGGQRQRVAIARALLGKPQILMFDEATSALDTEAEHAIQQNMDLILKNRTTLVIAHRLSTIRKADKIVVMDKGMIVETGTHRELMEARGLYYYLQSQQLES